MLTVIVPLDFSETSFNAAHYAAKMYKNRADINLVLYHFYTDKEDAEIAANLQVAMSSWIESGEPLGKIGAPSRG